MPTDDYPRSYLDYNAGVEPPPPNRPRRSHFQRAILVLAAAVTVLSLALVAVVMRLTTGDDPASGSQITPPAPETAESAPSPTPNNTWPSDVATTAHTIPAMIKNTITATGEQHGYEFTGKADQTWRITVEPRAGSTLDPIIHLYGPSGEEIASHDDRSASDFTADLLITLPEDGTYRLLVESSAGGITTGAYLLSVWVVD
ncbi:MAG: PPC domain-containing protein [Anaerolineae bacterium]|jgi:hypothetical protein|nr:PPC domain-containing protein [Anaerolineae bacterium]